MNSSKNKLQEYCQKNRLKLPQYKTIPLGDSFVSSVSIDINGIVLTNEGKVKSKKKAAEISAAEILLETLYIYLGRNKKIFRAKQTTRIMIDVENVPLNDFLDKHQFQNYIIDVFTSNPACIKKLEKYEDKINIHKVKSSRRDAADILLVLQLGYIIGINGMYDNEKTAVIVVTNDHFGDSLIDCLKLYKSHLGEYKCVNSLEELVEYIE